MRHAHAMSKVVTIVTSLVACVLALGASAAEATPTEVNVRIEGRTQTLFEGPILTEGHAVSSYKGDGGSEAEDLAEHPCGGINANDPNNPLLGPTATAASVDAMNEINETQAMAGEWDPGFEDYFVKQWGSEAENAEADGRSWATLLNNVFTSVGGCQRQLSTGSEVLWAYNAFEFRPFLALLPTGAGYARGARPLTATAQLGKPLELEVLGYEDDQEDNPPVEPERTGAVPVAGALVAPVMTSAKGFEKLELESSQTVSTDTQGKVSITFTTPGWHRIKAGAPIDEESGEEEAIRSNRLDVCVPPEGASDCGEAPAEDRLRVPPRYRAAIGPAPESWNAPRIIGRAIAGQTVTAGEGLWTGTEPLELTYRWQRCDTAGGSCQDIPGATTFAYGVTADDGEHTLRVTVTAHNGAGSSEADSPPTSEVPAPPSKIELPTTVGADEEGVAVAKVVPTPAHSPTVQTLSSASRRPPARATIARVVGRRLVLSVSVAGKVSVVISSRSRHGHELGWRTLRTLRVTARNAGTITVKLPALSPGSYRLAVAIAGSKPVLRVITVHRR
jgi:hypothetical protein